jgi:Protein of unknown function (DUF3093)
MPSWVALLCFLPLFAIGAVLSFVAARTGASDVWTVGFPGLVACALLVALILWGTNRSRKLEVHASRLRMGRRSVPFAAVENARYIDHAEAKRIQATMRYSPLRPTSWGNRKRQYGAWWQPWMDGAILLRLKPGSLAITDDWLIGTRHPQQLIELIQAGVDQAPGASNESADIAPRALA